MKKTKKQNLIYPDTRQRFIDLISFLLSFGVTVLVVYLVTLLPLGVDFNEATKNVLPYLLEDCQPEPYEMLQYAITVVLMPLSFLFFNFVLSKRWNIKPSKAQYYYNILQAGIIFLLVFLVLAVYLMMFDFFNVRGYTGDFEFYKRFNLKNILISLALTPILFYVMNLLREVKRARIEKIVFWLLTALVIGYGVICIKNVNYLNLNTEYNLHHFYAFWYPIYKVFSGKTPGVDFENIYGFYAYFVIPVLKILGGVCQKGISTYIAILIGYNCFCYYSFSYKFINNKFLAFIVATAGCILGPLGVLGNSVYYQYYPLRTVFLATAMLASTIYFSLKNGKKKIFAFLVFIVLGLGIAWNIESGLVALVFWSAFLVFEYIYENGFDKKAIIEIVKTAICAILSIVVFLAFVEIQTYERSGVFIGKDQILFGLLAFEGTGFNMIPLLFGVWIMVALLYAATLIPAIVYLKKDYKGILNKTEVFALFLSSVAGIGSFTYFVGRSYPTNIIGQSAVICICMGALIEYYQKRIDERNGTPFSVRGCFKNKNTFESVKMLVVCFCLTACLVASFSIASTPLTSYGKEKLYSNQSSVLLDSVEDIKKWSDEKNSGKTPNLLINYSIFFHEMLEEPSQEDVCEQIDWFFNKNVYTYIEFINSHTDESFVIDEHAVEIIKSTFPKEYEEALKAYYLSEEISYKTMGPLNSLENSTLYIYSPIK